MKIKLKDPSELDDRKYTMFQVGNVIGWGDNVYLVMKRNMYSEAGTAFSLVSLQTGCQSSFDYRSLRNVADALYSGGCHLIIRPKLVERGIK
ncbi:hypothetical protein [Lactiplantibacillus daowaiensis]|uniref:Uncharacterized protein n=1 Tax=Lactiplantibacillus daowaiensis TaxID=2559918 RepID=A0ABW1RXZ1_9LACO|nr:hypothetical protein [Lactiplantibacillus daowaiensis]